MGNKQTDTRDALIENRGVQMTDYVNVGFGDDGTAVYVATIPKGAVLLDVIVNLTAVFDDSGTDYLTVGTALNPDAYVDDLDVSSGTGVSVLSMARDAGTALVPTVPMTADTPIYAQYDGQNSNSTAGALTVSLVWVPNAVKAP